MSDAIEINIRIDADSLKKIVLPVLLFASMFVLGAGAVQLTANQIDLSTGDLLQVSDINPTSGNTLTLGGDLNLGSNTLKGIGSTMCGAEKVIMGDGNCEAVSSTLSKTLTENNSAGNNNINMNGNDVLYISYLSGAGGPINLANGLAFGGNDIENVNNVGIGTSSPNKSLHIYDGDVLQSISGNSGGGYTFETTQGGSRARIQAFNDGPYGDKGLAFYTGQASLWDADVATEQMRIDKTGDVGIGTTSPSSALDIVGGDLKLRDGTLNLGDSIDGDTNGDINMYSGSTSVPNNHLNMYYDHDSVNGLSSSAPALRIYGKDDSGNNQKAQIELYDGGGYTTQIRASERSQFGGGIGLGGTLWNNGNDIEFSGGALLQVGEEPDCGGDNACSGIRFETIHSSDANSDHSITMARGYDASRSEGLSLYHDNTESPTLGSSQAYYYFEYSGDAYGSSWNTGGVDLAEVYTNHTGDLSAGDMIGINSEGNISKTSEPYDSSAVGAISTDPGLLLGTNGGEAELKKPENGVEVALTGRVPLKVTTENGPIKPGDRLVASSTPGRAMKCEIKDEMEAETFEEMKKTVKHNRKCENNAIGRALTGLSSGEGTIRTFIE